MAIFNVLKLFLAFMVAGIVLLSCGGSGDSDKRYTIGGVVTAADRSMADSDVNDSWAPYLSNNDFATAQVVGNPLNLAGYVNVVEAGERGRSYQSGDYDDYFLVELIAGQVITLTIADWSSDVDLDLTIYDAQTKSIVADSLGSTAIEQLKIMDGGRYYIRVNALLGASNYVLNIGAVGIAARRGFSSFSEFVAGEVVVTLSEKNVMAAAKMMLNKHGLKVSDGAGVQLWRLPKSTKTSLLKNVATQSEAAGMPNLTQDQQHKRETLYAIKALVANPLVASAEPNYIYRTTAAVNDEYYSRQWHYPLINLERAWGELPGTHPVVVAVIDSGTLPDHPDLMGVQLSTGYDFVSNALYSGDGDGLDGDPTDEHDGGAYYVFHGTHVAGTVAAKSNNSRGVAGVAGNWPVKLMPLRSLGTGGGGTVYDVVQAIYYAAGLPNDSGIELSGGDVASVINMSLGGPDRSTALDVAIAAAINKNIIIVAAAGNDGSPQPFYPASSEGVLSVSAVGADKQLTSYSNYGLSIDLAAPGGETQADFNGDGSPDGILSTAGEVNGPVVDYNYAYLQGTSMASPHVAGVVALMKSIYPDMSPSLFDAWLQAGVLTEDIGSSGRDDSFGYGLIDAYKSVVMAQNAVSGALLPLLYSSPSTVDFGLTREFVAFNVSNLGSGSPMVASPVASDVWLSVDCQRDLNNDCMTDEQGLGRYIATIDRLLLPSDGRYTATITFVSDVDTGFYNIPVIAQRLTSTMMNDAGYIYIVLVDPVSGLSVSDIESISLSAINGRYHYQFEGIKAGRYQIVAGSDSDNDFYICDGGESCGAYPSYSNMATVLVNEAVTDLDFSVGIGLRLSSANTEEQRDGLVQEQMQRVDK